MAIFYILFVLFIIFAILDENLTLKSKQQILIISGLLMILFAGLRGAYVDKDYSTYKMYFNSLPTINYLFTNTSSFFLVIKIEPSLILIFSSLKSFLYNGLPIAIFIYAFLGVFLKLKAIQKLTDLVMLSTLIYFSGIFLLQDMTQIRVGVAIGFLLLSIPYIEEKNLIRFSFFLSMALLFHYSAIVFAPFYFLNSKKINKQIYFLLIIIPIILFFFKFDPITIISKFEFGIYSDKLRSYLEIQSYKHEKINMFNFSIIGQIIFSTFFVFFSEKTGNKYAILLTKINCFGVGYFYLFSTSPIIAFRLFELVSCVQIILIPLIVYVIKPKYIGEIIVISISIAYFMNQIVINNIFNNYTTFIQ